MRKSLVKIMFLTLAAAGGAFAAGLTGEYVEARTADVYTGPCFANGEVNLVGDLAVFGWHITSGAWQGVPLDGLAVAAAVKASATLGDRFHSAFPVQSILIVDERANLEQRLALKSFAQHMSKDLLQDIVRIEYQPVSLTMQGGNLHSATATLVAGSLAKVQTRALGEGDQICHNEAVWYQPLTELDHAMPAYTLANEYHGQGLNTTSK